MSLSDGDAFSKEEHATVVLEDVGADCTDGDRTGEAVRFFEGDLLSPAGDAEDTATAATVMTAATHGEACTAVEAVRGVLVLDPDVVEGVRRAGLFDSHFFDLKYILCLLISFWLKIFFFPD